MVLSSEAPADPLHPLVNGSYKGSTGSSGDTKVTLGNHVYIYKRYGDANWNGLVPLESTFTLSVGDVVDYRINVTRCTGCTWGLQLQDTSAASMTVKSGITEVGEYTGRLTISVAREMAKHRYYCTSGSTKKYFEYDLEIYVNGVRYI